MVATRAAVGPITAVAPMKVAQVPKPGGEFEIDQLRITQALGIVGRA